MYQAHFTWCWCSWWRWSDDFNVSKYTVSVTCEPLNYGVFSLRVLLHKGSKWVGLRHVYGSPGATWHWRSCTAQRVLRLNPGNNLLAPCLLGFPWWLRWLKKKICLQCSRPGFDPWVGKIPWRRAWQPTPVFLPRESHGQRATVHGVAELDTIKQALFKAHTMSSIWVWAFLTKFLSILWR